MNKFHISTPFHLRHTLESGQFFQWNRNGRGYIIRSSSRVFYIEQQDGTLGYESLYGTCGDDFIRSFFRLDDDLNEIFSRWSSDFLLPSVYRRYEGLRLMRQDPWECLVSFLCSAASNIPRITGNIRTLSRRYGTRIQVDKVLYYLFPTPEQLNGVTVQELYDAGLGFRARYLHALVEQVQDDFARETLRHAPYPEAKAHLTRLPGIGDKIADCVLLFSLDRLEAFPVDTWMIKILRSQYFPDHQGAGSKLALLARQKFGPFAGYAQQYLYHYARSPEFQAAEPSQR